MKNPTLKKYWEANSSTERIEIVEAAFALIKKQENELTEIRQKILNEFHLQLTVENFSTLIPNNEREDFYKGYIEGLEKAIKMVNNKIQLQKQIEL